MILGTSNCEDECTISNLDNLMTVATINGDFIIQCCNQLSAIPILSNLRTVRGTLRIFYNSQLLNIAGFSGLIGAGNVEISQNPALVSITGINSLGLVGGHISIGNNPRLERVTGFTSLVTISGNDLANDHGLTIVYNPLLSDIRGFRTLTSIAIGTVHIEGNIALCYAGYPLWSYGGYSNRYSTGDVGVDWRYLVQTSWQFTWGSSGGGIPSLVIQNNGNESTCGTCPMIIDAYINIYTV